MPIVNVAGVGQVNFPDSMTQDEIAAAIHKNMGTPQPEQTIEPTETQSGSKSVLKNIAGYADAITSGALQPFVDTGVGAARIGSMAMNSATKPSRIPNSTSILGDIAKGIGGLFSRSTGLASPSNIPNMDLTSGSPHPSISSFSEIPGSFLLPSGPLGKGVSMLAKGAGLGAGYGAAMSANDPNATPQSIAQGSLIGAAVPTAISSATMGIREGLGRAIANRLSGIEKKSEMPYTSIKSPAAAQNILNSQKKLGIDDLPISIGALTNSPGYNKAYEVMSKAPFAGQSGKMEEAVGKTDEAANNVYNNLMGGISPQAENILPLVKKQHADLKDDFKIRYDNLLNDAKQAGLTNVEIPNLQAKAKDIISENGDFLNEFPGIKKKIEGYTKDIGEVDAATGMRSNKMGLEDLKKKRTEIRELSNRVPTTAPPAIKRIIGDLYDAANDDIGHNIGKTNNAGLQEKFDKISSDYNEQMVPFKDISKVLSGEEQGDSAVRKILSNPKIIDNLNPTTRKLLFGHKVLSAIDSTEPGEYGTSKMNINANKLVNSYKKMDNSQKAELNRLLSPEDQEKLNALTELHGATQRLRSQIKPPETGAKLAGLLIKGAAGIEGAKAALAGSPSLAGVGAAGLLANRGLANLMTNPNILKAYANPSQRMNLIRKAIPGQGLERLLMQPGAYNYLLNNQSK